MVDRLHRAAAQRLLKAVHVHLHHPVPAGQGGGVGRHPRPLLARQPRHDDVRRRQRDPAVGGQAVMRDALVPLALVGERDPQARDGAAAEGCRRVDRLARRDAGVPPAGAGAQVPGSLGDDRHVGSQHVPGGEQAGVDGHRLQVAAERLPRRHRPGQPVRRRAARRPCGRTRPGALRRLASRRRRRAAAGMARPELVTEASQHGREGRVQVGHHDRHAVDRVRLP